jgi:hypothetical protein
MPDLAYSDRVHRQDELMRDRQEQTGTCRFIASGKTPFDS